MIMTKSLEGPASAGSAVGVPLRPATARHRPLRDSLWATFEALAEDAGQRHALLALDREPLRFIDVPTRLRAIRDFLADHGIGRGHRVASVLPHSPETAVCFLGVACCAIHVPLNPEYTESEFTRYLAKLGPAALIVCKDDPGTARRSASGLGIPVIDLVIDIEQPAGSFSMRSRGERSPIAREWNTLDDVALVLLTSGTTAEQKFVPVTQRHLLAYARAMGDQYHLGADDRGLHVMPMFHGHGLKSSLLVPLVCGSGVICSGNFDIPSFFRQMIELRATWYSAASSIHHVILQRIDEYREVARSARLRFVRSGSAHLDPKVMAGLEEAFGAPVLERYGMSETCTLTSNPLPPGKRKPGSVGTPVFNEVAVIDEAGNVVAAGGVGEVIARGPGVFDGYLDDPAATAAAFVSGWFRTGDLGRFDDDGYLTLVGRVKHVINRGGEKIGTLEVETALLRHPAVVEACVFPISHPTLGEEVSAAVVLAPGMRMTERELRSHASGMLTGFKVPRRITLLSVLPKNATGKLDRDEIARICAQLHRASVTESATIAQKPWTVLEQQIAGLWQETLDLGGGEIDREDDFFLRGGDSLQAYELFARLRERYGISVGLGHLFDDAATVAGMARLVERNSVGSSTRTRAMGRLVSIKEAGRRPPLFAVPGSGGNPVGFIHLGRLLNAQQPLIGIESRGMDGSSLPLSRVEDIAADNLADIRALQPAGPYFLTGACYGARVAYEMARQLEAANERVGLLLMLDPSSPFHRADGRLRRDLEARTPTNARLTVLRFLLDRIMLHSSMLARMNGAERAAYIREKSGVLREMVRRRDLFRGDRSEIHQRRVYAANRHAGQRYVPGTFGGPVVVCLTRDRPTRGQRNYRLDWLDVVPQAGGPRYVAGRDSGQMLNLPHVYELATYVNRWLDEAHATDCVGARRPAEIA